MQVRGRPEARGGNARLAERVVQHPDDPGGALVARPLEAELLEERLVRGDARDRDRPAVRDVGEQRAERDDHRALGLGGDRQNSAAKRPPLVVGFDPAQDDEIPVLDVHAEEVVRGPRHVPSHATDQFHLWSARLEVDVGLGVDSRDAHRCPVLREPARRVGSCVGRVVPPFEGGDEDGV